MPRKIPVKCVIAGCHRLLKMTLAEREELRRVGREKSARAGPVCPAHVKAAFNVEFGDIYIDVPLEALLVEASRETPRWRVMLIPLPVEVQRECPVNCSAEMSNAYSRMVSDADSGGRRVGGLSASMYLLTVCLWIPNSLAIPRMDSPLRLASCTAFHLSL